MAEPDRQLLANVRWLAGFRERPTDLDGEQTRMLAVLATGGCTIGELVAGARVDARATGAGEALADLSEPLAEASRVWGRLRVAT